MLMDVLNDLYKLHVEMLELAKHKRQVLIEGKINELSKIIQIESNWVKKVGKLEEERMVVLQNLLKEKGLSFQHVTMADLSKILTSPKEKEQLQQMSSKLSEVMEEIKQINDLNTQLVQQSLDYIDHTYRMLFEDNKEEITYSNPKNKPMTKQKKSIFDQKA